MLLSAHVRRSRRWSTPGAVLASFALVPLLAACSNTSESPSLLGSLPALLDGSGNAAAAGSAERTQTSATSGILAEARALRRAGEKKAAFDKIEAAAAKSSDRALLAEGGLLALEVGTPDRAEALLGRAHDPAKPDWRVLSGLGVAVSAQGRHEEAKRHFKAALALAPGQPSILNNLGLAHVLEKQPGEAHSMLKEAAKAAPKSAPIKQNLALARDLTGRFEGAGDASKPPPATPVTTTPSQPAAPAAVPPAQPPAVKKPAVAAPVAPASDSASPTPATAATPPAPSAAWSLSSLLPAVATSAPEPSPAAAPRERVARASGGAAEGQ